MRLLTLGSVVLCLFATVAQARTFTNASTGKTIEATYLGVKDGKIVLRLETGKVYSVPGTVFTEEDQAYFKQVGPEGERVLEGAPEEAPKPAGPSPMGDDRFSQAIAENPNDPSGYVARGMMLTTRGNYAAAIQDFSHAIQLDPKNPSAYNGRGKALMGMGDAAAAHNDFTAAIELNPKFVPAYRNRADNGADYYKTPQGMAGIEEELAKARKKRDAIERVYQQKFPWQPRHTTKDEALNAVAIKNLVATDRLLAERWQEDWDHDHGVDFDYGASAGIHYGYGAGGAVLGGGIVGAQTGTVVLNPGLAVYPLQAQVGEMITLVANPSELAKGMQVLGKGAAPVEGAPATPEQIAAVKMVDFYRDVNGNGTLEKESDQYLATDGNGSDGYSTEVPTGDFDPGNQTYFAVPKGDGTVSAAGGAGSASLILSQSLLAAAAKAERNIADQAGRGASTGLDAPTADALSREQSDVAKVINDVAKKVAEDAPELAARLKELRPQIGQTSGQLRAIKTNPGDASKGAAANAATAATGVADALEGAAVELAKMTGTYEEPEGEGQGAGEGAPGEGAPGEGQPAKPPTDEQYAGAPAAATGQLTPAPGAGPGKGGPGKGGPGGDGDDDNDVVINNNYGDDYDGRDGRDIVINNDYADDDDVLYRARTYAEDGDYDAALLDYDRLVARRPGDVRLLRDRADTYLQRGSYEYAVKDYDRMIELAPRNADFYYNRGCAQLAAGAVDQAISDFTMSINLDELGKLGNLAYNNRGSAYAQQGKYELAIADFEKAIEVTPSEPLAYRNKALALKLLGRTTDYEAAVVRYREIEAEQTSTP